MNNSLRMENCIKCGGARFYGSVIIGWGGPICNCVEPVHTNPPTPVRQDFSELGLGNPMVGVVREIMDALKRIEQKLGAHQTPTKADE